MASYPDYLCYYYRKQPTFQSILEMGLDDASSFLKINDCKWRSEESYLPFRIEVESWVKNQFAIKGGSPQLDFPIYMTLGHGHMFEKDSDYKGKMLLPLDIFSRTDISFTYSDSMHTSEGKQPIVFMLDEIEGMIDKYGNGYAEAQIWNKKPLNLINEEYLRDGRLNYIDESKILDNE